MTTEAKHTPGPWIDWDTLEWRREPSKLLEDPANARLMGASPELLEALHEGRRAIGEHFVPDHCYATGPVTGDEYRDLVQCPACSFIAMYDAALSKARGA